MQKNAFQVNSLLKNDAIIDRFKSSQIKKIYVMLTFSIGCRKEKKRKKNNIDYFTILHNHTITTKKIIWKYFSLHLKQRLDEQLVIQVLPGQSKQIFPSTQVLYNLILLSKGNIRHILFCFSCGNIYDSDCLRFGLATQTVYSIGNRLLYVFNVHV